MTLIIQQHVLWFEVSVDDPLLMEVLHTLDDLSSVVAGSRFIKAWIVFIHVINVIPWRKKVYGLDISLSDSMISGYHDI